MTSIAIQFVQTLKKAKQSNTAARGKVFEMIRTNGPLTMAELVASLSGEVDRASAYRAVELFETLGIVQRINIGWKYKLELTDNFQEHHHHLVCTKCEKLIDISENSEIEDYLKKLSASHGFKMTHHQMEIQGLCKQCQASPL